MIIHICQGGHISHHQSKERKKERHSQLHKNFSFHSIFDSSPKARSGFFGAAARPNEVMDPIVEVVALVLGFVGWVMVGVALPNRYWRTSTVDGNVITTSTIYENLWMSCATDSTGVHNCREFPSLLALSGYIQASRALMITSVVLGSFGLVAALIGVQCSKAGGENYILKGRITGTAGVLFILQGVCTMVSVSWYAFNITQDFFNPLFVGTKYEIGEGLYIGWCSAVLAIVGGACLTCSCKMASDEKRPMPYSRGTAYSGAARSAVARSTAASTYGRNAYV
ncbi:hypothetical protein WMY93_014326 [Mugilogobius chulae]|uniref:Claudin n=1 Tax=Mugilogobius chulae TaxID=88201 RepID=A0AAW0P5V1_9GOBI